MQIIRDQVQIFELLSASGQWPEKFDRSLVFYFEHGDDYCFTIFESSGKGFVLYLFSEEKSESWEKLITALQDLYDEGFPESLISNAILEASARQLQLENGKRYFDAH